MNAIFLTFLPCSIEELGSLISYVFRFFPSYRARCVIGIGLGLGLSRSGDANFFLFQNHKDLFESSHHVITIEEYRENERKLQRQDCIRHRYKEVIAACRACNELLCVECLLMTELNCPESGKKRLSSHKSWVRTALTHLTLKSLDGT